VRVVYVCAEGSGGFQLRVEAYERHHGEQLDGAYFRVITDVPNLLTDDYKALGKQIVADGDADVIVIDTLAQVSPGGDENSAEDMGRVLAHCRRLNEATGALVVLIHHAGKDLSRGARGWSGLKAAADFELEVARDETGVRTLRVSKLKDGRDGAVYPFQLLVVPLGMDEDEDVIDSCVVEHLDQAPAKIKEPGGKWQRRVWRAVNDVIELGEEWVAVKSVVARAIEGVAHDPGPDPKKPKKDWRQYSAKRAVDDLVEQGLVVADGDKLRIKV
jgi:hypothetical protein